MFSTGPVLWPCAYATEHRTQAAHVRLEMEREKAWRDVAAPATRAQNPAEGGRLQLKLAAHHPVDGMTS